MRPEEETPLDLNNIPQDSNKDDNGVDSKKKRKGKNNDYIDKVYECRFCSLKFTRSQALGGHMNRHRQERETETLKRARMLVYNNDNVIVQAPSPLGNQAIPPGAFHQASHNVGDPAIPAFQQVVYTQPIAFSTTTSTATTLYQAPPAYIHASPSRGVPTASHYHQAHQNVDAFVVGHAVHDAGTSSPDYVPGPSDSYYTCIGAPVEPPHRLNENSRGADNIRDDSGLDGTLYHSC